MGEQEALRVQVEFPQEWGVSMSLRGAPSSGYRGYLPPSEIIVGVVVGVGVVFWCCC